MVCPYRQDFVYSNPEFMLKIYYKKTNLGITVCNTVRCYLLREYSVVDVYIYCNN